MIEVVVFKLSRNIKFLFICKDESNYPTKFINYVKRIQCCHYKNIISVISEVSDSTPIKLFANFILQFYFWK